MLYDLRIVTADTDAVASAVDSSLCSASDNDGFLLNDRDIHFRTPYFVYYVDSPGIAADTYSHALRGRSHTFATRRQRWIFHAAVLVLVLVLVLVIVIVLVVLVLVPVPVPVPAPALAAAAVAVARTYQSPV